MYATLKDQYNFYFAQNGAEGLKMLEAVTPDCIVSDVQMPMMSGLEFLEKSELNIYDHIPFIFLSSLGADQDIIDGFRKGATDYVSKPFRKEVLRTRVREHIERKVFLKGLPVAKNVDGRNYVCRYCP
ncbi:MAG: response regulator [Bdellovibrionota bacterium]